MQKFPAYDLRQTYLGEVVYLESEAEVEQVFSLLIEKNIKFTFIDLETNGLETRGGTILLISISVSPECAIVFSPYHIGKIDTFVKWLVLVKIANQSLDFDAPWIYHNYHVEPTFFWCTELAAQYGWGDLLPEKNLAYQCRAFFNIYLDKSVREKFVGRDHTLLPTQEEIVYAGIDVLVLHKLLEHQWKRLTNINQLDFFLEVEMPVLEIMTKSSYLGYRPNEEYIQLLYDQCESAIKEIEQKLTELWAIQVAEIQQKDPTFIPKKTIVEANDRLTFIAMLDHTGIKTGTTKAEVVEQMYKDHPTNPVLDIYLGSFIELDVNKEVFEKTGKKTGTIPAKTLYSKYVKPIVTKVSAIEDARIHPRYRTCINTGRLSSKQPNIMAMAELTRPMIIADEGCSIVSCDYSSYEFRACAAEVNEQILIDAFVERARLLPVVNELAKRKGVKDGDTLAKLIFEKKQDYDLDSTEIKILQEFFCTDIHRVNAARMFGGSPFEITKVQRSLAKTLGYANLYGAEAPKNVESLQKEGLFYSLSEVEHFMSLFEKAYPSIEKSIALSMKEVSEPAFSTEYRDEYYTQTILGRKRWFTLPANQHTSFYRKCLAENQRGGYNHKFQGNNADATKIAIPELKKVYDGYNKALIENDALELSLQDTIKLNYSTNRILWPVHDEINSNIQDHLIEEIIPIKVKIMEDAGLKAVNYKVPMEIAVSYGKVWPK